MERLSALGEGVCANRVVANKIDIKKSVVFIYFVFVQPIPTHNSGEETR